MQTTFGAPSGAFDGSKGDQSGVESLISTLMVPLNGSLTVSSFPQPVWIFGESGENLGLSLLELGLGDDAAILQVGELGKLVGAALGARGVAHVLAELLVLCWASRALRSCIEPPRAMTYTRTPRNGRMTTKISQRALAHPLRSLLRKMSKIIQKSRKIHSTQRKNHSIVRNASSSGYC